jgi:Tat protein secretion system quality control protein TatD with DNase activity
MIDSHCHLAGEEFADDLQDVVDRAIAAGVTAALVVVAADDDGEYEDVGLEAFTRQTVWWRARRLGRCSRID